MSSLSVASWPAYSFLKRQVRWSGIPISFRIFQSIVIHTVKGFGIVNKAEIDVFLELSCFFDRKGNQSWIVIGRDGAEDPILWPLDAKSQLFGKDPDAGKDWRQKAKEMAEDESKLWETVEDRGAWHAIAHWVAKHWTQLSNWTVTTVLNLQKNRSRLAQKERSLGKKVSKETNGIHIILYYIHIISLIIYSPSFIPSCFLLLRPLSYLLNIFFS